MRLLFQILLRLRIHPEIQLQEPVLLIYRLYDMNMSSKKFSKKTEQM